MKTLSELLARIKTRPLAFLHGRGATLPEACIDGFLLSEDRTPSDRKVLADFRQWLCQIPGIDAHASMAVELIQLSGSDDSAFDAFFKLFDQFVRSNPV